MAKIVFIQDSLFDQHSIQYLSAVLKQTKHEVDLFVVDAEKDKIMQRIRDSKPDIVAFSITSMEYGWATDIAKKVKKENLALTIFGGPHPTYFPDFIKNDFVDIVCIGEGEGAFVDLANAIDKKEDHTKIQNLWVKKDGKIHKNELRPLIEDLDSLPFPDKEIYYKYKFIKDLPTKRIIVSRGCPYACSYCFNHLYNQMYDGKGKFVRYRKPEKIIQEIKELKEKYPLKTISFSSDTFTLNRKWLLEFLELYKYELKIPFICNSRANEIDDEVAKKLSEAGCFYTSFGVEAGNERIRNEILKKNVSNKQIIDAANSFKKYNIKYVTYNMFGLPTETLNEAFETMELNAKIKANISTPTILQPIVGTTIYKFIQDNDLFVPEFS
ncbi:B12-binding domain-containing radical SAM protein, partial [Candidatus Pacearchaeota archaeon]|nr:B12-binding domain-containing radical SAM protein [Candidatus Pacearchaeota archaeon]